MKLLLFIIVTFSLVSCDNYYNGVKYTMLQKPFIIIQKEPSSINGWDYAGDCSAYLYQDKLGNIRSFVDKSIKFNVGDTLK